ncbi:MAG: hypothetical protein JWR35_731 [Marmoricola sp.]|nr:hypothetical protein [Marmoricola sp.]
MTIPVTEWTNAQSIDDVLDRMEAIETSLPASDGVATFNRMYNQVTKLVRDAVSQHQFEAGEFLERLDVNFANLYFAAHQADLMGTEVPRAWAPLFLARARPHTVPIQFAFAGMNAHISHDLPFAVVTTCQEMGVIPREDSPEHVDYTETNRVLAEASETIKGWFITGVMARLDQATGPVDDAFEMFGIHAARSAAWGSAEMLWRLSDNPRLDELFRSGLSRSVEMANRGILL